MAAFNGLIKATFLSQLASGQSVSNSFHLAQPAGGSPPDVAELTGVATDLQTYFSTTYRNILMNVDTWQKITCYQVSDPLAPIVIEEASVFPNLAGTGSAGSRSTPDSVAGVMSFKTPNASRRYRGHLILPGPWVNTALLNDKIDQTNNWWTNAIALVAKFATGLAPTPTWTGTHLSHYELAIYSNAAALASAPSVSAVSAVVLDPYVHWLRSRERGSH
jgi:hypothetical protein